MKPFYLSFLILIFASIVSGCKAFKGTLEVSQPFLFNLLGEDDFYEDEYEDEYEEEISIEIPKGRYPFEIRFDTRKDFSISFDMDDYSYESYFYISKGLPNIEKEGTHRFSLSPEELSQRWSFEGAIETTITNGDEIEETTYCTHVQRVRYCRRRNNRRGNFEKISPINNLVAERAYADIFLFSERNNRRRDGSSSRRRRSTPRCHWETRRYRGVMDSRYYTRTSKYDFQSRIIQGEDVKAQFHSNKVEQKAIYTYRSCCYSRSWDQCLADRYPDYMRRY